MVQVAFAVLLLAVAALSYLNATSFAGPKANPAAGVVAAAAIAKPAAATGQLATAMAAVIPRPSEEAADLPDVPSVRIVTYAQRATPSACGLARSAAAAGVNVTLLALSDSGASYAHVGPAPTRRLVYALRTWVETVSPDSVVIYISADSPSMLTPAAAVRGLAGATFAAVERVLASTSLPAAAPWPASLGVALFAAERSCQLPPDSRPDAVTAARVACARLAGSAGSSFRYPDSRAWAARQPVAVALLDAWAAALDELQSDDGHEALLTLLETHSAERLSAAAADGIPQKPALAIALDDGCELFQSASGTALEQDGWDWAPGDDTRPPGPAIRASGEIVNEETATEPLFVFWPPAAGAASPDRGVAAFLEGSGDAYRHYRQEGHLLELVPDGEDERAALEGSWAPDVPKDAVCAAMVAANPPLGACNLCGGGR